MRLWGWIVVVVKRILGCPSPEPRGQGHDTKRQTPIGGDVTAQSQGAHPEVPGLDEWIKAFDLDPEKARLAGENARLREENVRLRTENARLWKELIDRNARLEAARAENEKATGARTLAERGFDEALEREMEVIAALLPNVEFVRDSREVVRSGLRNRLPILAVLRELSVDSGKVKGTRVQAAEGWLEQHFQTGERDNGRIYFRCSGARCKVLVSFKVDQGPDTRYLQSLRM